MLSVIYLSHILYIIITNQQNYTIINVGVECKKIHKTKYL